MPFDLSETKRSARQAIHGLASVVASYTPRGGSSGETLTVRWHNKTAVPVGDLENSGYAEILTGVDRLVFSDDELTAKSITLQSKDQIVLYGVTFSLENRLPNDGPVNVYWEVVRL